MIEIEDTADGMEQRPLPDGWRWVRLGDVCEMNPRRPHIARAADEPTSFISMAAVNDGGKGIAHVEAKPFGAVQKGYTYFANDDVLFAKITPCMQNAKIAVVRNLIEGIGFGSTEFHVLRPSQFIQPEWVQSFLRQRALLNDAERHMTGTVGQQRLPASYLAALDIPLPPLPEQRRIAAILRERLAAVEAARKAAMAQISALGGLVNAYLRESLSCEDVPQVGLASVLVEVSCGVGSDWDQYRVVGATRAGLAPAKESIGKTPERYKFVDESTIFYNPMRILLGSIAMIDEGDEPGITSPDYVVFKTRNGILHHRWFYYWLRSPMGEDFIKTLARGAVRERMLFRRLADAAISIPPWDEQLKVAEKLSHISHATTSIKKQFDAIAALPQALLRQAFAGEL